MLTLLLMMQAAQTPPDLQLDARVQARSVTIEKKGDARLTVTTSPDGGNVVDVQAPKANGRKTLRNVDVTVHAEGRIGDPAQPPQNNPDAPETPQP